jgi:hypothetical protein
MEQERRSPYLYPAVWAVATLFVVLLLVWLAAPGRPVHAAIGVSVMPPRSGHMGNFYSERLMVALVTNSTQRAIGLELPVVEWEANGVIITALANLWGGTNGLCSFGSNELMRLPFEIPTNSTKFRVSFEYWREAGPLQKILCPVVGRLFPPTLINLSCCDCLSRVGSTGVST